MEGSRRRNPHDVGDVAGESSRSDQKIQGVDHFVVNLFLCLRDGSGLDQYLNDPSLQLPFSIFLSTILVPVGRKGSGEVLSGWLGELQCRDSLHVTFCSIMDIYKQLILQCNTKLAQHMLIHIIENIS